MGWIFLICWVLLSACIALLGRLVQSDFIIGIGAVMILMTALVNGVVG